MSKDWSPVTSRRLVDQITVMGITDKYMELQIKSKPRGWVHFGPSLAVPGSERKWFARIANHDHVKESFERKSLMLFANRKFYTRTALFGLLLSHVPLAVLADSPTTANVETVNGKMVITLPQQASPSPALADTTVSAPNGLTDRGSQQSLGRIPFATPGVTLGEMDQDFIGGADGSQPVLELKDHRVFVKRKVFQSCLTPEFNISQYTVAPKGDVPGVFSVEITDPSGKVRSCMKKKFSAGITCNQEECTELWRIGGEFIIPDKDFSIKWSYQDKNQMDGRVSEDILPKLSVEGSATVAKRARAIQAVEKRKAANRAEADFVACAQSGNFEAAGSVLETLRDYNAIDDETYQTRKHSLDRSALAALIKRSTIQKGADLDNTVSALEAFASENADSTTSVNQVAGALRAASDRVLNESGVPTTESIQRSDAILSAALQFNDLNQETEDSLKDASRNLIIENAKLVARSAVNSPQQMNSQEVMGAYTAMEGKLRQELMTACPRGIKPPDALDCQNATKAYYTAVGYPTQNGFVPDAMRAEFTKTRDQRAKLSTQGSNFVNGYAQPGAAPQGAIQNPQLTNQYNGTANNLFPNGGMPSGAMPQGQPSTMNPIYNGNLGPNPTAGNGYFPGPAPGSF